MSRRWWLRLSIHLGIYLGLLLCVSLSAYAEDEPKTADEVISRYLIAIGAERFSSISTLEERGDVYGNVENFWQGSRSPGQSQSKEHGTFEFYFKSPNLRFSSTLKENNTLVALHGCDGKISWLITAFLKRIEFTPKPGREYDCENGFEPALLVLRKANVKMRLTKKKEIDGRMAWEVRVDNPKSTAPENYYFDADTFMLLRSSTAGYEINYSDYREIGGMKFPFSEVSEFSNSKLLTTIRELKINASIDDARFVQPILKNGKVLANPDALAKASKSDKSPITTPSAETSNPGESVSNESSATGSAATLPKPSAPNVTAPENTASITEVNFPNFTSCTVAELLLVVPDLKDLKPATDQRELVGLLDKVGAKTVEIARNTPNLISHESVTESEKGLPDKNHDYDYLIVTRVQNNVVGLSEFRVDVKTGDKFQTDAIMKDDSAAWTELERASQNVTSSQSAGAPASQGFATSWVHFYPNNRSQATFRYLGTQKMNGRHALVLAFAQKPESVISPAILRYQGKIVPMFLQGFAWVDPSDFRILRLRTDLLSPLAEVSLHRLTADIRFVATRVEEVQSPLWLPRDVAVTSEIGGSTIHEIHKYSEYRLFRTRSRIVLNP